MAAAVQCVPATSEMEINPRRLTITATAMERECPDVKRNCDSIAVQHPRCSYESRHVLFR